MSSFLQQRAINNLQNGLTNGEIDYNILEFNNLGAPPITSTNRLYVSGGQLFYNQNIVGVASVSGVQSVNFQSPDINGNVNLTTFSNLNLTGTTNANNLNASSINSASGTISSLSSLNGTISTLSSLNGTITNLNTIHITNVSSINGAVYPPPAMDEYFNLSGNTLLNVSGTSLLIDNSIETTNFSSLNGTITNLNTISITNLSTINGAVYPPPAIDEYFNLSGNTLLNVSGTSLLLNNSIQTTNMTISSSLHVSGVSDINLMRYYNVGTFGFMKNKNIISNNEYCLSQANNGDTFLNCASGRVMNFRINNVSNSGMILNSTGLGIGTSSPSQKLEVIGQILCNRLLTDDTQKVKIGFNSGLINQGTNTIAIGNGAGFTDQLDNSIAIGLNSGRGDGGGQGINGISIGANAGRIKQGTASIAIGANAGILEQSEEAVAIGINTGRNNQSDRCVAIGTFCGENNQGSRSVAIGRASGRNNQLDSCIAIGNEAGSSNQGTFGISLGRRAGENDQSANAISIGVETGRNNQGQSCIAIGRQAGYENQANNSIVLNATGAILNNTTANSLVVKPIRASTDGNWEVMAYNNTSGEIIRTGSLTTGNVGIGTTNITERLQIFEGNYSIRNDASNRGTPRYLSVVDSGSTTEIARIGLFGTGSNNYDGNITFGCKSGGFFNSGTVERMRLTNTGLGINTSAPQERLHIIGNALIQGNIITSWSSGRRLITNFDSGNNYRQGLLLDATSRNMTIFSTSGDSGGAIIFNTQNNVAGGQSDTFYGTERMRILASGNVGIGLNNPSHKLSIFNSYNQTTPIVSINCQEPASSPFDYNALRLNMGAYNHFIGMNLNEMIFKAQGNSNLGNYTFFTGNGTYNALKIASNGNVGISNNNPLYRLQVDGDVNITGNYRINGTPLNIPIGIQPNFIGMFHIVSTPVVLSVTFWVPGISYQRASTSFTYEVDYDLSSPPKPELNFDIVGLNNTQLFVSLSTTINTSTYSPHIVSITSLSSPTRTRIAYKFRDDPPDITTSSWIIPHTLFIYQN